ncbi:MAG TPA: ABC transporter permease [Acidobacteriaceae bacterium]|nr:ABC transporter permease [Acidobacteriaceae bacterium]
MIGWLQDLHYALRQLRKSPGFALTAVLTLAMAIGANAVVFSVMNGLILRPLHVPQPQSLYAIERGREHAINHSYPDYLDLRDRNHSFDGLATYSIPQVGLNTGSGPVPTWGVEASGNYFDVLRIRPWLGRFFHSSDERGSGSAPYLVLSYAYWHAQFHDDRTVVGRIVQVNKHPFTIIGVAPPGFRGTLVFVSPNFFVPLVEKQIIEGFDDLNDRGGRNLLDVFGHLKPGVTPAAAIADLDSVGAWLEKTYPKDEPRMTFTLARPSLLGDQFETPIRAFLAGLALLATLILLAACANLGSLFAARAADRSREVALRLALGSSRRRIVRALFTEAIVLALAGGAAGIWASAGLLHWLADWQPFGNFPLHTPVTPDAGVYVVALLLTLASGFLFGAVPVRQVLRANPWEVVKSGLTSPVRHRISAREFLVAAQIAICAVLVTSSIVAVRGLARSLHDDFGFNPTHSILVETDLTMAGYTGDSTATMQKNMLDAIAALPGVQAVGLTDVLLLNDTNDVNVFTDKTVDLREKNSASSVYLYHVSPQYLQAEGTALLAGRAFTSHDNREAPHVAIVNAEFARRIFGSETSAIGSYFKLAGGARIQVVGVAQNGKYSTLTEAPHAAVFLPILQWPSNSSWLVVRSNGHAQPLAAAVRNALHRLDPGLPVSTESRYDEMAAVLFGPRMATVALGVLGAMGALLSISGIFGMAAYSVSKRLRELGIRVALGAQRKEVLQAALGRAFQLLGFGSAAGLLIGVLASRVLAAVVYLATPRDPLVLLGVVVAMALVGLVASWIPAQRALSIDPAILLREE